MKSKILLLFIILLAVTLRFYRLDSVPPGLYFDEASIAYNAYSIIETGKDEYGTPFPILFRSYNDYKPGGYIYAAAISEKIFGANDFAVRLPSALAGVFTVFLIYLFVQKLSKNKKWGLLAALCLAISPWHLWFSRAAFESNLAVTLILACLISFLAGLTKHRYFLLSFFFLVLGCETYLSARVVGPIMIGVLGFFNRQKLHFKKWETGIFALILIVIAFTLRSSFISSEATGHMNDQSVLSLNNNPVVGITKNFVKNISFDFLFFRGDQNPLRGMSTGGVLYFWQLISIIVGIFALIKKRYSFFIIFSFWVIIGSLPATLSNDSPQAIRGLMMVIPWQIITAFGLLSIPNKKIFQILAVIIITLFQITYLHSYYIHIPSQIGQFWGDGMKESVKYINQNQDKYSHVYIYEDIKYAYFLWYGLYDPLIFQKNGSVNDKIGKIVHIGGLWKESFDVNQFKDLFVRSGETNWILVPSSVLWANSIPGKKVQTILYKNNNPGYYIYEF